MTTSTRQAARSHDDLEVFRKAYDASMRIFSLTSGFPKEEVYSLTSQIRRSSRGVCSAVVEAWRKRRYEAALVAKLSDAEAEAAETQLWIRYAVDCGYLDRATARSLYAEYNAVLRTLVGMAKNATTWTMRPRTPLS